MNPDRLLAPTQLRVECLDYFFILARDNPWVTIIYYSWPWIFLSLLVICICVSIDLITLAMLWWYRTSASRGHAHVSNCQWQCASDIFSQSDSMISRHDFPLDVDTNVCLSTLDSGNMDINTRYLQICIIN